MHSFNESTVEEAALSWFGELGYSVANGPDLAPGEPDAERDSLGDAVLVGRLSEAIDQLTPTIPLSDCFALLLRQSLSLPNLG